MKPVLRSEILDYMTYGERREQLRPLAMQAKAARRIVLGDGTLTFLFENRDTVRYQVQEMMRTERIVREADIEHELSTYNELLGGPGELGCTLLIGIDEEAERAVKLGEWKDLPQHVYAERADGSRVPATFDSRQVGDERLSSVQYLKFAVGSEAPVALGVELPGLEVHHALTDEQRAALQRDLADD
ncbi:DUF3501 family protein [Paraliomyxa miuraensis]|uniref:DUF3501 family protein n=1 Tax=Paraliomyxa miuraensis TaxID=376150 RepID=UPI00225643CE|nr:DUF3501 family protein [Paraliomyxa miuraensis]MCX4247243.1 DUF3501 family protein [Paraliomyxa miuraensis]